MKPASATKAGRESNSKAAAGGGREAREWIHLGEHSSRARNASGIEVFGPHKGMLPNERQEAKQRRIVPRVARPITACLGRIR